MGNICGAKFYKRFISVISRDLKYFGINLNFDSLGAAYGWPSGFKEDKAFTKGLDRITSLCRKLNIPITIFVVGKDLENTTEDDGGKYQGTGDR